MNTSLWKDKSEMLLFGLFENIIKQVASEAIHQAMEAGQGVVKEASRRAMDVAVDVGKKELRKGVQQLGKTISIEMIKGNPQRLSTEVVKLAGRSNGELTIEQVMAEFELEECQAKKVLDSLVDKDICFEQEHGELKLYIFPGFKSKKQVKKCEYCDNTYDIDALDDNICPSCGAQLITSTDFV